MTFKTRTFRFKFSPSPWDERLEEICESWKGTKYRNGDHHKGSAVDCIHFMGGVFDEMYGSSRVGTLKSLRGDVCLHDNGPAIRNAIKAILRTYPAKRRPLTAPVESGDVLVIGPPDGGPGHVMLFGGRPGILWHAVKPEVQRTGYGHLDKHQIPYGIYRVDKESWSSTPS